MQCARGAKSLALYPTLWRRDNRKLHRGYTGPWTIKGRINVTTYELEPADGGTWRASVATGSNCISPPPSDYVCTSLIPILTRRTTNAEATRVWKRSTGRCPPHRRTEADEGRIKSSTTKKKKRNTPAEEAGPYRGRDLAEGTPLAYEED